MVRYHKYIQKLKLLLFSSTDAWLLSLPSAGQEVASVGDSGSSSGNSSSTTGDTTTTDPGTSTPTGPTAPSGNNAPSGDTTSPTTPVVITPISPAGPPAFTQQVEGMVFVHPDHLGSVTMLTDGRGVVLTGGSSPGKSHISYKPYGEIHRTDSAGPDIVKYKYTGQEEDRETGLYYYKARYYDPALGRFISPDTMSFKGEAMGMNRHMYVNGNPITYTDPTGHYSWKNFRQDFAKHILEQAVSKTSETSLTAGYALNAWGQKNIYKMRKHKGIRNDYLKFMNMAFNPFGGVVGLVWGAANYITGQAMGKKPSLKFVDGGVVVQGGGLVTSGITLGNVAVTPDHDRETFLHESAHIKQFNEMGIFKYYSHLGSSPLKNIGLGGSKTLYYENEANKRAGTFGAYDARDRYQAVFNSILIQMIRDPYNKDKYWNDIFLWIGLNDAKYVL